ncbi:MAG: hypothetical protein AAGI38_14700, partial [Bacteroidota bacterium]
NVINEEGLLSIYPNQKEQKVDLQYEFSPNKRRLLCYKNLENRRESEQILYYMFDERGNYTGNGEIALKYPDNRFRVRSLKVSNEGNIYLLGKFYLVQRIRDAEDFKYLVYKFDPLTQQGKEIEIEIGDRYISDLAFRVDRNENIYAAGFYSNQGTDQIIGTLVQKLSPEGEVLMNSIQKFKPTFLSQYLSSGQINRGRELKNFYLKNIVLRSDGGLLLVAEKYFITYNTYRDPYGYFVDREVYHYEDIILTSVSGQGSIEWQSIVEKNQVSENPGNLSYFNAIGGEGAYVFYEYKPRRQPENIYFNLISFDGDVSLRKPLLKGYRYGNSFSPRFCEQINNREALMVYFQNRGRTLSVIKLNLNG